VHGKLRIRLCLAFLFHSLVLIGCGSRFKDTIPEPVGDFNLSGSKGGTRLSVITSAYQVVLIYVGYSHCLDFCPSTLSRLALAINALSEAEQNRVRVVFVSVDPERDTPTLVNRYAIGFQKDFLGYTGSVSELTSMLHKWKLVENVQENALPGAYSVDHSTTILWVENGLIRKRIPSHFLPDDLTHDLRLALR